MPKSNLSPRLSQVQQARIAQKLAQVQEISGDKLPKLTALLRSLELAIAYDDTVGLAEFLQEFAAANKKLSQSTEKQKVTDAYAVIRPMKFYRKYLLPESRKELRNLKTRFALCVNGKVLAVVLPPPDLARPAIASLKTRLPLVDFAKGMESLTPASGGILLTFNRKDILAVVSPSSLQTLGLPPVQFTGGGDA